MSPDPLMATPERLLDPQERNMYGYARNNPLSITDPTGLDIWKGHPVSGHPVSETSGTEIRHRPEALNNHQSSINGDGTTFSLKRRRPIRNEFVARQARLVETGTAFHVTARSNYRQTTFYNAADRTEYLELLERNSRLKGLDVLGWCLMTNHVHLLAVPGLA